MTSNIITEVAPQYEPCIDMKTQCMRDLDFKELRRKYDNLGFRCCGTLFTPAKYSQFRGQHIKSQKHIRFIEIENEKYKQEYGSFSDPADIIQQQRRELKLLKIEISTLNKKLIDSQASQETLKAINNDLRSTNIELEFKIKNIKSKRKNLKPVPCANLITFD